MNPSRKTLLYSAAALALAGAAYFIRAHHSSGHDHAHADQAVLALNDGQRWATDQALRTGMRAIRVAAAPVLAAPPGRVTPADAAGLADALQEQTKFLFAHCKLPPQADATLHVILTELLTGSALLAKDPASAEALGEIRRALARYPQYFDDPGWTDA